MRIQSTLARPKPQPTRVASGKEAAPAQASPPDPELDLFSFSARNPGTTAMGVGMSTLVSTAVPGIVAGVAATALPGLSPITKSALEMFSAFSVMGSLGSASWAYSKAKKKFAQRRRQLTTVKLRNKTIKNRGSLLGTSKTLAGRAVKGSLIGVGLAGMAATGLELAARSVLPASWIAGVASTGFTYLGLATLTHNFLNAELGHRGV